ncbi:DUF4175 family protein [Mangrovimonas xylaniphaga]|uniref:DUF4175 family protein n=1 Tax=Mangrovimonas xylaniphaga TaxID=1645915 RepID=UPI0006B434F7|nr:DUF4175 family protein [Mangrovimonas xylaniphaga]
MSHFNSIQLKLEEFIRRYYFNELLKGAILFFAIGLLYFLLTLFIEYVLWLNPTARTIMFWVFIAVEFGLFLKFILLPLAKLFKLQKGINYEQASEIIGKHFPEVSDKLLNVLQLQGSSGVQTRESDLLLAGIEQKAAELQPVPFKLAINFKKNFKYLKYAAIPLLIIGLSFLTGHFNLFRDSYERVVNYKTAYEPPAPFKFFVLNDNLTAVENKNYVLKVSTAGKVIPENAQIQFNNETYFLQQTSPGHFEYVFEQPMESLDFRMMANDVVSRDYTLEVTKVPALVNFEMLLYYPGHTKKGNEVLKSTGSATVPEGTKVTWKVNTRSTEGVTLYAEDTLRFEKLDENNFEASKQLFNNSDYQISTSNHALKDYESLAFTLKVIKDDYPEIRVQSQKDSLDQQSLYFYGQVSDDYGLSKLQLVYYPVENESAKEFVSIPVNNSNFDEFVSAFPNQLNVEPGKAYELFFQVFDNDRLHNYKQVKSQVFSYRKLTSEEEEAKQLNEQNETIKDLNNSFDKLKEQDQQLEEFSKTQKEKEELNFNDKQKLQQFLKRQKAQEEMMQNFNKKLQENLEEFQKESNEKDEFKEALKERLEEQEQQLKQDEKVLEELEKLQEKIQKEELTDKLEQLAKQNKNKQRSLEQLLELTKRYYVAKKAEQLQQFLEQLSQKQEDLSNKNSEENNKEAQDELNKAFEEFQKEMDELEKENEGLKKPMDLPKDDMTEEEIKEEQQGASEDLEKQEQQEEKNDQQGAQQSQQNAKQKQKSAAQKMKQMSSEMSQGMMGGGGQQMAEDAEMLRQILDNLVVFSFDQEALLNTFKSIEVNHNEYGKYLRKQSSLREHFEHIDDSLFSLSLRQPMLSEQVNSQITEVFYNIDKSLEQLSENQLYQGIAAQQYTITATNTLASFLSDVLDNMEAQMNSSPGQGQGSEMQLPDIIKSQGELNKEMQEQMDKQQGKPKDGHQQGEQKGQEPQQGQEGEQNGESEQNNEEMNGELFGIYQRQQELRNALEEKLTKEGLNGQAQKLLKDMEEVELDLLNKGFTNQTLQKMMELEHQLLKMENATFMQGEDNKRQSETNLNDYDNTVPDQIPTAREYFNTTEILNRQALPLQQIYKVKVQEYFKRTDD